METLYRDLNSLVIFRHILQAAPMQNLLKLLVCPQDNADALCGAYADFAAELLVEYKKSLNVALALSTVRARHEQIELQKQQEAERRAALEQQHAAEEKVQQAIEEAQQDAAPPVEEVSAPEEEQPAAVQEPEETQPAVYEVKFAVRGTIEQLKKLKQFIMQEGMSYDDI